MMVFCLQVDICCLCLCFSLGEPLPCPSPGQHTQTHTPINLVHLMLSMARLYLPGSYNPWSQELVQYWAHVSGRAKQNWSCDFHMNI